MFVDVFVCPSICVHDNTKYNEQSFMIFYVGRAWPNEEVIKYWIIYLKQKKSHISKVSSFHVCSMTFNRHKVFVLYR